MTPASLCWRTGNRHTSWKRSGFNRQKHTLEFPAHCLDTIFGDGGLSFEDIDVLTTPWKWIASVPLLQQRHEQTSLQPHLCFGRPRTAYRLPRS